MTSGEYIYKLISDGFALDLNVKHVFKGIASIFEEQNPKDIISIYSVLNNLDFKTSWIGNQTPEKSYSFFRCSKSSWN